MKTSDHGIAFIKRWEGVRLKAYRCSANVLTIGVGHTAAMGDPKPVDGMKITEAEAEAILRRDLGSIERDVAKVVTVHVNQRQFDTLVSFVFNVGIGAFRKSTLLKKLNASRYDEVPSELMKWTRAGGRVVQGLVNRRKAEADLWRGAPTDQAPSDDMPQQVDPPRKMTQSKEGNMALLAGGVAGVNAASEAVYATKNAHDTMTTAIDLLTDPRFIALVLIVVAAAAIWYWRKQRMDKDGY